MTVNRYRAGQPSEQTPDLAALTAAYQQALEDFRTLRTTREGFDDDLLDAATELHVAWTALKVAHARHA